MNPSMNGDSDISDNASRKQLVSKQQMYYDSNTHWVELKIVFGVPVCECHAITLLNFRLLKVRLL